MSFDIPDWGGSDGFSYGDDSSQFSILDLSRSKKEQSKRKKNDKNQITTENVKGSQQSGRKRKPDDEDLQETSKKKKKIEKLSKEISPEQAPIKKKKPISNKQVQDIVKESHKEEKSDEKIDTPVCATAQNTVAEKRRKRKSKNKYATLNIRQKEERNEIILAKKEAGLNVGEIPRISNDKQPVAIVDMEVTKAKQKKYKVKDLHGRCNGAIMRGDEGNGILNPIMEGLKAKKKKKKNKKFIDETVNQEEKNMNKDETKKENIDGDEIQKVENIYRDELKKQSNSENGFPIADSNIAYLKNERVRKKKKKRKIEKLTSGIQEGEREEEMESHVKRKMKQMTENEVKLKEGERDTEQTGSLLEKKTKVTENRNLTKGESDAEKIAGPTKKKRMKKTEDKGTTILQNVASMNNERDIGTKVTSHPKLDTSGRKAGNCVEEIDQGLNLNTMDREAIEDISENISNMKLKKKKKSLNLCKNVPETTNNKIKNIEKPVCAKIKGTVKDTNQITQSKKKTEKKRREVQTYDINTEVLINDDDDSKCDDQFKSHLSSLITQLNFERFNKSSSKRDRKDGSDSNLDNVNRNKFDDEVEDGEAEEQVRRSKEKLNKERNNSPSTKNTSTKNYNSQIKEMHKPESSGNQKDGKKNKMRNHIAGKRPSKLQREKLKLTKNLDEAKPICEQPETPIESLKQKMAGGLTAAKFSLTTKNHDAQTNKIHNHESSDSQKDERGKNKRNHNPSHIPSTKKAKFDLNKLGQYLDEAKTTSKLPATPAEKLDQHLNETNPTSEQLKTPTESLKQKMERRLIAAKFRHINEELYTINSKQAARLFKSDPEAFSKYHQGYQDQVKRWPFNPLDHILQWLNTKPKSWVIADLGCGEATLSLLAPQTKIHSFDFVASNPRVTACDMAKTPLGLSSIDVVVFCLSLMGTNIADFIAESNRILREGGIMKIAEVESRFGDTNQFVGLIGRFGFHLVNKDASHPFFHLFEFKKNRKIKKWGSLPEIRLKPCVYKRC